MRVCNMTSPQTGNPVANQFIVHDDSGFTWFQSYRTMIACVDDQSGTVYLDDDATEYSRTTSKYLKRFLESYTRHSDLTVAAIRKLVASGEFKTKELN